jgi:hypothetical protein
MLRGWQPETPSYSYLRDGDQDGVSLGVREESVRPPPQPINWACLSSQLHRRLKQENCSAKNTRPYSKNNKNKKGWGHSSSDREPA